MSKVDDILSIIDRALGPDPVKPSIAAGGALRRTKYWCEYCAVTCEVPADDNAPDCDCGYTMTVYDWRSDPTKAPGRNWL